MTTEAITAILNRLIEIDGDAVKALIDARVPCNDAMRDMDGVTVACEADLSNARVGFLGVLQAIYSMEGSWLHAEYDDDGRLTRFFEKPWPEAMGPPFA